MECRQRSTTERHHGGAVTTMQEFTLARRVASEAVGTAMLLAAVVGSGIMGERLAGGNVAVALLANTVATGAALVALILAFGPISGARTSTRPSRSPTPRRVGL